MIRKDKQQIIDNIAADLKKYENFYLTDIATLNAESTNKLRRECFQSGIKLIVVKNTLLKKAFESLDGNYEELYPVLKGNTAIMFSDTPNAPAKIIDKYKAKKIPALKAAYVQECFFIGGEHLAELVSIKSKNELIGDIIMLLQSPTKNVISALQSGGNTIHGVLKTLAEKARS